MFGGWLAQGAVPQTITEITHRSRLTALQTSNSKVRGARPAALSDVLCVGNVLAKQVQEEFRREVAPANFGLCDRSRTDALEHLFRAASDA